MSCAFEREKLTGYYDGELDAGERSDVEAHIASCSECLRDLDGLKSVAVSVKGLTRHRVPASLSDAIRTGIREPAAQTHSFSMFRRLLQGAVAAAAVVLVAITVMLVSNPPADEKNDDNDDVSVLTKSNEKKDQGVAGKMRRDADVKKETSQEMGAREKEVQDRRRHRMAMEELDAKKGKSEPRPDKAPSPEPAMKPAKKEMVPGGMDPERKEKKREEKPDAPSAGPPNDEMDKLTEEEEADDSEFRSMGNRGAGRKYGGTPQPVVVTVSSVNVAKARRTVESILKKKKLTSAIGTGQPTQNHFTLDNFVYVDLSEEEYEQLTRELQKTELALNNGYTGDLQALRGGARQNRFGGGGSGGGSAPGRTARDGDGADKEGELVKGGNNQRGRSDDEKSKAEDSPELKKADAGPTAQKRKKDEENKENHPKPAANDPGDEGVAESTGKEALKGEKEAARKQDPKARAKGIRRYRLVIYFRELAEKKTPAAEKDK